VLPTCFGISTSHPSMAEFRSTAPTTSILSTLSDLPGSPNTSQSPRKRRRPSKHSPTLAPEAKLSKSTLSPEYIPQILTGAAAIADAQRARQEQESVEARQTSPNPGRKTLGDLLGSQSGMSRIHDAPSQANTLGEPLANIASAIKVSPMTQDNSTIVAQSEGTMQTSPQSTTSLTTLGSTTAPTLTANGASVASPGQVDDMAGEEDQDQGQHEHRRLRDDASSADVEEGRSNKAFTYPGPMLSAQAHRTSSLPQSGYGGGRDNTRSPSTKRHKCPYCSTDFTRHHNLKSHLLTHSHEKPYSCDTCEARFRRLHDLKRHTKLHTGERPHVCSRCDRSFARGDALARHTKGQGGCAGRRSSMGSFGGDDKHEGGVRLGDEEGMPGIMYTGEASHEPEHMDEDTESLGGRSLPSIRKHEAPPVEHHHRQGSDRSSTYQPRQPSTYPPVAARPPAGGLYPPPTASPRGGSGTSSIQSSLNQAPLPPAPGAATGFQASGSNVFAQGGMTESPKPLSPAGMTSHQLGHPELGIHRNRSPSLTQQFQQHQFGRRVTGNNTSPPMSLPPPHANSSHLNAPQLPSLPGLNPPETRYALPSQGTGPPSLHSAGPTSLVGPHHGPISPSYPPGNASSANNSLSSHGTGPLTNPDRHTNSYVPPNDPLWSYVKGLEVKVDRLQDEVGSLKTQLSGPLQQHR
jgi:hypothetical protein